MYSLTTESGAQKTGPICTVCDGTGWRSVTGGTDNRVTRCDCHPRHSKFRSVLPPLYHDATLAAFPPSLVVAAEEWMKRPQPGLLLLGPVGTGKTWLAAAIARVLVNAGKGVHFACAADFYLKLRSAFSNAEVGELAIITELVGSDVLVLDDLGAGSFSDFERRSTLYIIQNRLSFLRPTIVTTNLTLDQIATCMDDRIASRLSGFTRIALAGRDRRNKIKRNTS